MTEKKPEKRVARPEHGGMPHGREKGVRFCFILTGGRLGNKVRSKPSTSRRGRSAFQGSLREGAPGEAG